MPQARADLRRSPPRHPRRPQRISPSEPARGGDASAATPVLRSISMLIPQARAIATLKYIGTGSYPFVGGLQAEAKLTDSHTGDVLGEWVDRRIGGGSAQTAAQWQWGDAENAINAWSAQSATKLASWTSGTATP